LGFSFSFLGFCVLVFGSKLLFLKGFCWVSLELAVKALSVADPIKVHGIEPIRTGGSLIIPFDVVSSSAGEVQVSITVARIISFSPVEGVDLCVTLKNKQLRRV